MGQAGRAGFSLRLLDSSGGSRFAAVRPSLSAPVRQPGVRHGGTTDEQAAQRLSAAASECSNEIHCRSLGPQCG